MELTWNYIAWLKCLFYSLAFSFTTQETGELTGKWRERDQDVTETGIEHGFGFVFIVLINVVLLSGNVSQHLRETVPIQPAAE